MARRTAPSPRRSSPPTAPAAACCARPPGGPENVPVDVIFPVMHGEHAEDGTIQGLFEMAGIPYVGCGVLASSTCMDKDVTHILLEAAGIRTAPYACARASAARAASIPSSPSLREKLGYPMFVKPANTGSSVGVGKAKDRAGLRRRPEGGVPLRPQGGGGKGDRGRRRWSAPCWATTPTRPPAVVGEIVPRHEFYDYEGKYLDDSTDLFIPARIPKETSEAIRTAAVRAYRGAGLHRALRGWTSSPRAGRRRSSSTRSTPCPASPPSPCTPSCSRRRASPIPS